MIILTVLFGALSAVLGALLWRAVREERRRSEARVAALANAIDGLPPGPEVDDAGPGLFRSAAVETTGTPVLTLAAVGLALLLIVVVALASGSRTSAPAATATAIVAAHPLELLSLRYSAEADRLTVTGLVRNPSGAAPVSRLTAIVFFFDPQGTFITSARTPLDLPTLNPGDEAPFAVSVPNEGGAIGRYRVTFRSDSGVVRHVDRRSTQNLARQEAP